MVRNDTLQLTARVEGIAYPSRLSKIVIDLPTTTASWRSGAQPLSSSWPGPFVTPEHHGAPLHGQESGPLIQRLGDGPSRGTRIFTPTTWPPKSQGWKY